MIINVSSGSTPTDTSVLPAATSSTGDIAVLDTDIHSPSTARQTIQQPSSDTDINTSVPLTISPEIEQMQKDLDAMRENEKALDAAIATKIREEALVRQQEAEARAQFDRRVGAVAALLIQQEQVAYPGALAILRMAYGVTEDAITAPAAQIVPTTPAHRAAASKSAASTPTKPTRRLSAHQRAHERGLKSWATRQRNEAAKGASKSTPKGTVKRHSKVRGGLDLGHLGLLAGKDHRQHGYKGNRLTLAERRNIVSRMSHGGSATAIAAEYGIRTQTVYANVKRARDAMKAHRKAA